MICSSNLTGSVMSMIMNDQSILEKPSKDEERIFKVIDCLQEGKIKPTW